MKESKALYRSLRDVSIDELRAAVAKMSEELGISGSGAGYNLYTALYQEREKAIKKSEEEI